MIRFKVLTVTGRLHFNSSKELNDLSSHDSLSCLQEDAHLPVRPVLVPPATPAR